MKDKKHLCIVIDRNTRLEIKDYIVESSDWYYARHKAARLFEQDQQYQPNLRKHTEWYVDSCELE